MPTPSGDNKVKWKNGTTEICKINKTNDCVKKKENNFSHRDQALFSEYISHASTFHVLPTLSPQPPPHTHTHTHTRKTKEQKTKPENTTNPSTPKWMGWFTEHDVHLMSEWKQRRFFRRILWPGKCQITKISIFNFCSSTLTFWTGYYIKLELPMTNPCNGSCLLVLENSKVQTQAYS